jgi:hypothetical protein
MDDCKLSVPSTIFWRIRCIYLLDQLKLYDKTVTIGPVSGFLCYHIISDLVNLNIVLVYLLNGYWDMKKDLMNNIAWWYIFFLKLFFINIIEIMANKKGKKNFNKLYIYIINCHYIYGYIRLNLFLIINLWQRNYELYEV